MWQTVLSWWTAWSQLTVDVLHHLKMLGVAPIRDAQRLTGGGKGGLDEAPEVQHHTGRNYGYLFKSII